jgi:DNA-binding transcriptional MerR regulator
VCCVIGRRSSACCAPGATARAIGLFTEADIRKVRMIHYLLKHRGFTIQGAREQLRTDPESAERLTDLRDRLVRVRELLVLVGQRLEHPVN